MYDDASFVMPDFIKYTSYYSFERMELPSFGTWIMQRLGNWTFLCVELVFVLHHPVKFGWGNTMKGLGANENCFVIITIMNSLVVEEDVSRGMNTFVSFKSRGDSTYKRMQAKQIWDSYGGSTHYYWHVSCELKWDKQKSTFVRGNKCRTKPFLRPIISNVLIDDNLEVSNSFIGGLRKGAILTQENNGNLKTRDLLILL